MTVEHVLGINPYAKPVGFKGVKGKVERRLLEIHPDKDFSFHLLI